MFAVADGMGGHAAGDLASRIAVETLSEIFVPASRLDRPSESRLEAAFERAHERILERGLRDPAASGMGTTLTAAWIGGGRCAFAHIGDSRLYRFRKGVLALLTTDHNLAARMRFEGHYPAEEYERGPLRHALYAYVGRDPLTVQLGSVEAAPGDVFVLATDGFVAPLAHETLASWLAADREHADLAGHLADRVSRRKLKDNATVVAARVMGA